MGRIKNNLKLLNAASAVNGEPTLDTQGKPLEVMRNPDKVLVLVDSTAGSGTMSVTVRMWGFHPTTGKWYAMGVGSDSSVTGIINGGNPIGENGIADRIGHAEVLGNVRGFSRLYAEVTAITGTLTTIDMSVGTRDPGNLVT